MTLEIVGFATDKDMYAIQVGAYGLEKNAEKARSSWNPPGSVVTIEMTGLEVARVLVRGIAAPSLRHTEDTGRPRLHQYLVKKERTANTLAPGEPRSCSTAPRYRPDSAPRSDSVR